MALGLEEGEAHAAADEQLVDLRQQRLDDGELVGDLRTAEDHDIRPLGVAGELRQHVELAQHQAAGVARQQRRHVVHAGVLAVHRAERVVDIDVGELRRAAAANALRSASSLLVSPALKRRFSSSATSPSPSPATAACACSPTVSVANATGLPSSSPSRFATGGSVYFGSGAPFGRPRCDTTVTRAPASRSALSVGRTARMRPSSVISSPSSGTFRSARRSTRRPATPSLRRSSSVFTGRRRPA